MLRLGTLSLTVTCSYFMLVYGLNSRKPAVFRIISLVMLLVTWFVPYGWLPGMIWGGVCWADSRSQGNL